MLETGASSGSSPHPPGSGLRFSRVFSSAGAHPFEALAWERRTAWIANETGETLFEQKDVEVPAAWSQQATNVTVQSGSIWA